MKKGFAVPVRSSYTLRYVVFTELDVHFLVPCCKFYPPLEEK
ncbi:hypothetical protein NSE_0631 [Neorickettsia sennetsu str. Miyayama]|uniref:Uncharacterized protein n=1 Tax=Ehrlichia sennetsu (strain ATCC VR-367 / Miyayama) TaxID=222891 RepID=Q2GDD7_EHRS3|nr:hypothetical protein NSE_0631 [Neorickettsia sennetsu str. Miyayama]